MFLSSASLAGSHRFAVPAEPSTILGEISQEELDSRAQQQWWNKEDCQHFWKTWCLFGRLVVFLCLGRDKEGRRHLVSQVSVFVVKRTSTTKSGWYLNLCLWNSTSLSPVEWIPFPGATISGVLRVLQASVAAAAGCDASCISLSGYRN